MTKINLPFWLSGEELEKLVAAFQAWWDAVEQWLRWPLSQFDAETCSVDMLNLMAYQRDIKRFKTEPLELFRKRVRWALINAQDAGSKAGFMRIFDRLGLGVVEITERFDTVDWDVIKLEITDNVLADNTELLMDIIQKYGRTCRRYTFTNVAPMAVYIAAYAVDHQYYYTIAK